MIVIAILPQLGKDITNIYSNIVQAILQKMKTYNFVPIIHVFSVKFGFVYSTTIDN